MVFTLIIVLLGLSAVIGILRPQIGAVLIWVFPWIYPNTLLYNTLPLNIRFDDLWVVYMFVICLLLYRQGSGLGKLTWLALLWWMSILLGNMTGLLMVGGETWQGVIKLTSKSLYVPMTTYVLSCLLESPKAMEDHIKGMMIAGLLAGVLGIAMNYFPGPLGIFFIPTYFKGFGATEMVEGALEITRRAQGSVGTVALAIISSSLAILSLLFAIHQNRKGLRLFSAIACGILMISLAYTATRGAIGGVLVALLWAVLFTRRRGVLISLVILGGLVLMWQGGLIDRIMLRIVGNPGGASTPFLEGLAGRFAIFEMFLEGFQPVYLIFGMGMTTIQTSLHATAHNTYIGSFVYGGVVGAVVLILIIVRGIQLGRALCRSADDPFSQSLGNFMIMLVIAMMTYGVVAENFQQYIGMQIYFAAMLLVEKRLRWVQAEQEAWLDAYEEPAEQLQPAV